MRRSFATHGIPRYMVTDNGPQFRSEELEQFMRSNSIRHQCTPPYHPATNGQVERMVQELKKSLKGHCPDCTHVFHTHAKLEKIAIFSSFSLTSNRIETYHSMITTNSHRFSERTLLVARAGLLAWRPMSETCPSSTS